MHFERINPSVLGYSIGEATTRIRENEQNSASSVSALIVALTTHVKLKKNQEPSFQSTLVFFKFIMFLNKVLVYQGCFAPD